ncbi:MAG: hypothetical protein AB1898_01805 [Acidobacteriota bacterium]
MNQKLRKPERPSRTRPLAVLGSLLTLLGMGCVSPGLGAESILIKPEIQFQRMEGFGGFGGHAVSLEIQSLPFAERTKTLDLLFGTDGARLNILRCEIPSSGQRLPFTHPMYLRGFIYDFADDKGDSAQFFVMREALRRSEVIFNGCVFSPPPGWKSNQSTAEGGTLLPDQYTNFADYLASYLTFYRNFRNHPIQVLSLQNQPDQALAGSSCLWRPEELAAFLKVVVGQFTARGAAAQLMLPDTRWDAVSAFLGPLVADPELKKMVGYVSGQSGTENMSSRTALTELCREQSWKIWQTYYQKAEGPDDSEMARAMDLAITAVRDLTESEVTAWLFGPLVAPADSPRAGLLRRERNSTKVLKSYSAMSQFSRFIPRDAVRISAEGGGKLPFVAFRNPSYNGMILVIVNPSTEQVAQHIEVRGWTLERAMAYRTSATEECSIVQLPAESGSRRTLSLEPRSILTLVAQMRRTTIN